MIVRLAYNCDPDSLADVTPDAFVNALENELAATPGLQQCALTVTFHPAHRSRVESVAVDDDSSTDPAEYDDMVRELAERAFRACCEN